MATDWLKLQTEYLETPLSLRALAVKHGVSPSALQRVAAKEGWAAVKHAAHALEKTKPPNREAPTQEGAAVPEPSAVPPDRLARLRAIGDRLTDQLARATVELDKHMLKHRRKTREMLYEDAASRGKPVEETVEENYAVEIVDGTVNCAGLQKLSATLKYLSDAAMAGGGEEQSVGMVAELMKKLDDEAAREDA